jgi:2',3'-cyclic-nucleotide 2'-phosphodiesterase
MRLLFLGDIVGRTGRDAVIARLPSLRRDWSLDAVIVNGENAAGGFGITEAITQDLLDAGVDVITLGNHAFDQREAMIFITRQPNLIRPANFPPGTPGRGATMVETASGARLLVINIMGRLFMDSLDDPFPVLDRELEACPLGTGADAIVIDVHAEATSEKQILGHYCDGRASLVVGTHTHVPTADSRILPHGTAFQSDAGMCGDYNSVIGLHKDEPIRRLMQRTPGARWEPAEGPATLCGIAVETDRKTGLACAVASVRLGPLLEESRPSFW